MRVLTWGFAGRADPANNNYATKGEAFPVIKRNIPIATKSFPFDHIPKQSRASISIKSSERYTGNFRAVFSVI